MANPLDTDAGTELFASYEAEFKLVHADMTQKLDQAADQTGEPRRAAAAAAGRALDEARELLDQMRLEKQNMPSAARTRVNPRLRGYESEADAAARRLRTLQAADQRSAALFGARYQDDPNGSAGAGSDTRTQDDAALDQRQQLLAGTDRLDRSTQRLLDSRRLAEETESIGANTLLDLRRQRETIEHTQSVLLEGEGYVDRSIKTLRGMARRMATNRVITISIITILVLLIIAVIFSKFR